MALGIAIMPNPLGAIAALAREAEDAGFAGIFMPEITNDGMLCCQLAAAATQRIGLYTWITNIHYRQPPLCAGAAAMLQQLSGGRFKLGLGVSHRPAMQAIGIDLGPNARDKLRSYILELRRLLGGEVKAFALKPATPIPIYIGALALETARTAGEIADGLELYNCPPQRVRQMRRAAEQAAGTSRSVHVTTAVNAFVNEDVGQAYESARRGLSGYATVPFYNRQFAKSGFAREAAAAMEASKRRDRNAVRAALTHEMLDAVALIGPVSRCAERLQAYREAGTDLPVIVPISANPEAETRRLIKAFGNYL
jgi:alkanesulfonate monooxygenase SsuD/methylene tetrahydromethanopterin reductase-like flavin-dependent oxidoreductase (luciferase family)